MLAKLRECYQNVFLSYISSLIHNKPLHVRNLKKKYKNLGATLNEMTTLKTLK